MRKLKFPDFILTTPARIKIYSGGLNPDTAEPLIAHEWAGMCSINEKSVINRSAKETEFKTKTTVLVKGDIAPNVAEITGGKIFIGERVLDIKSSARGRNPDGSAFSTELYTF